ncbi:hypothetical protein ACVWXL_004691 [Bradyrhizobium sp. GM22.5]
MFSNDTEGDCRMVKLKIGTLPDDKPVKLNIELPASVHRDLLVYAQAISRETGQSIDAPKLISPMIARFMATDRAFSRVRRNVHLAGGEG